MAQGFVRSPGPPLLVWLVLTKRLQNIIALSIAAGGAPPNAALGTTCEDRKRWDLTVPELAVAKYELRPLFTVEHIGQLGRGDLSVAIIRHPLGDPAPTHGAASARRADGGRGRVMPGLTHSTLPSATAEGTPAGCSARSRSLCAATTVP